MIADHHRLEILGDISHNGKRPVVPRKPASVVDMRLLFIVISTSSLIRCGLAQDEGARTRFVRATYRLEHPVTTGTCFIVSRPVPLGGARHQLLLITAAHALRKMEGVQPTVVLRRQGPDKTWEVAPREISIRRDGIPLWHEHPQHDIAVLDLREIDNEFVDAIPLKALADAADWTSRAWEPGDLIRCVGFPHAAQFKPSEAAFPMTRLGCIASYPLGPYKQHPTFLVDYNSFEGDSGALVYVECPDDSIKIIGLVQGQHFVDERYQLVYAQGLIRERLGLAVVVNSQAILETISRLTSGDTDP